MAGNEELLMLPELLTVDNAAEVKNVLLDWLQAEGPQIRCRGSDVSSVDSAGLQLLVACYKTMVKAGKGLVIVDPSPVLQEALKDSGVDRVLTTEVVC